MVAESVRNPAAVLQRFVTSPFRLSGIPAFYAKGNERIMLTAGQGIIQFDPAVIIDQFIPVSIQIFKRIVAAVG